jgi:hypothetical protein
VDSLEAFVSELRVRLEHRAGTLRTLLE